MATVIACVAGGSGCARETFCGEAANSLAGLDREGIFASGEAGSEIQLDSPHSSRDQRGFLHSRSGPTFARVRTPAGYAGYHGHDDSQIDEFAALVLFYAEQKDRGL